ncbi:MAG: CHAT domain-containing protein [Cyanobacteria bacterium SBLK]|nr:CHAT domain-containing protein [Cyanobacteria bacterium SBLK]
MTSRRSLSYFAFVGMLWVWEGIFLSVAALDIIPEAMGTGTLVNRDGQQFNIEGGILAEGNLFHSFEQFGLQGGQVANFLSAPGIHNILGRVVGGNPSIINGLIQVTGGNSHLFLMNPAGMVFGVDARLNVPGDFTATAATAIGFGNDRWFNAVGTNDYSALIDNPHQFAFDLARSGAIVNGGDLAVNEGQNLALIGGNVINTGNLRSPRGQITIAAIPHTALVKISRTGSLLSLEIHPPRDVNGVPVPITALDLPTLLTGSGVETGLKVEGNTVKLADSGAIAPPETAMAIAAGTIDVSGEIGGEVNVLGDRVALLNATLEASGRNGGGTIRIGGDYQGQGNIINAKHAYISQNSRISANALENGHGGQAIVWADETTRFFGSIETKGGAIGGNGGFVEVSGKETLDFRGGVDTSAPFGNTGALFLDPTDINIVAGSTPAPTNALDGFWFAFEDTGTQSIGVDYLRSLLGTGSVSLFASNNITWEAGVTLDFDGIGTEDTSIRNRFFSTNTAFTATSTAPSLILDAGNTLSFSGNIVDSSPGGDILNVGFFGNSGVASSGGSISTGGGNIAIGTVSGNIEMSSLNLTSDFTPSNSNGGTIALGAPGSIEIGAISAQGDRNGGGTGGTVYVVGNTVRINATVTDQLGTEASITTTGAAGSGGLIFVNPEVSVSPFAVASISDLFTVSPNLPFTIGNAATNGTIGAITTGDNTLTATLAVLEPTTLGNLNIFAIDSGTSEISPILASIAQINPIASLSLAFQTGTNLQEFNASPILQAFRSNLRSALATQDMNEAINWVEVLFCDEFEGKECKKEEDEEDIIENIRATLKYITRATGTHPALVYAISFPEQLELVLVTPEENIIRKVILEADASQLKKTVARFRQTVTNPRRPTAYLSASRQLYHWLVAPLERELERLEIDTLIFSLDAGLRGVPLAALQDGEQFLIEKYSLGVIPSVSLTNTRYEPLQNPRVLAMGASEFSEYDPLPAVPVELSLITEQLAEGTAILNHDFTFDNLRANSQNQSHQILHLATHADFQAGDKDNAHIQLWNDKLAFDRLRELGWTQENPIELLVLSACRTALGDLDAELGFAGLAVNTGAKSALASLWYVSDGGTLNLMSEFYRHLQDPDITIKAEALRRAQIAMLRGEGQNEEFWQNIARSPDLAPASQAFLDGFSDRDFTHPYYWSAFTLVGSPW